MTDPRPDQTWRVRASFPIHGHDAWPDAPRTVVVVARTRHGYSTESVRYRWLSSGRESSVSLDYFVANFEPVVD